MHRNGVGNDAEGCAIVKTLKPFPEQALNGMAASGVEDVVVRRLCQGTRKTGLEGISTEEFSVGMSRCCALC